MNKQQIIKFIDGKADEREEVLRWIEESPANKKYYFFLKNLLIASGVEYIEADTNETRPFNQSPFHRQRKLKCYRLAFEIAACILLLIAIGASIHFYNKANKPIQQFSENTSRDINKLSFYTNKGVKGFVVLPDSSKVWLNSDSKITYPEYFDGRYREVEISGEAFFDVVKNPEKAMLVTTNKGLKIEVLGTKFLIRSYNNDKDAQATLFTGLIKLRAKKDNSKEYIKEIKPQESILIPDDSNVIKFIPKADTIKSIAWKSGKLLFEETPIEEVVKKLERWHGVEFIVTDKSILNFKITAQFKSESIVQILEIIRFCSPIEYKIAGEKIYLSRR